MGEYNALRQRIKSFQSSFVGSNGRPPSSRDLEQ
jgi:hypothetical protein